MISYSWTLALPAAPTSTALGDTIFSDEALQTESDFGFDIVVFPTLDMTWTPRRDAVALADAFLRRLFTPRGRLWAHPNYGFDIRDYLNDEINRDTLNAIKAGCEAQAEQEERIFAARARVSYDLATEKIQVSVGLESAAGPFSLVLSVASLTTDILLEV